MEYINDIKDSTVISDVNQPHSVHWYVFSLSKPVIYLTSYTFQSTLTHTFIKLYFIKYIFNLNTTT